MLKIDMPMPNSCLHCPFKNSTRTQLGYVVTCNFMLNNNIVIENGFNGNIGPSVNYVDSRHPKCPLEEIDE